MAINSIFGTSTYDLYNKVLNGNLYGAQSKNNASNYANSILSALAKNKTSANRFDFSAKSTVTSLKTNSAELSSALSALSGKGVGSSFRKKAVASSDTDVLTVKAQGNQSASFSETTVKVDQIATGQTNKGDALQANAKASSGYYQFALEVGGKAKTLSFVTSPGDSNEQMQKKMADAINQSGMDVTASVSVKDGKSTLSVQAKGTGADSANRFEIKDLTGDAVAKTGVGSMTIDAQDARYSIDGGEMKTSKSNDIQLGNGVTATLKQASPDPVTVKFEADRTFTADLVKSMTDSYNGLLSVAKENGNTKSGEKLFTQLMRNSSTYVSSLSKIGVGFDKDGNMKVDGEKLNKAIEDGSAERFFSGTNGANYGFSTRLTQIANDVNRNTGYYASGSTYNSLLNSGLVFDYYI